ncbi:MAG: FkbM family methyltransferase [Candidatus Methylacidiphilales bacterium]
MLFKKRFKKGAVNLNSYKFHYTDAVSFLAIYSEVFNKKIYNFKTNSNQPIILDCGANIGLSVLFFKKMYPNAIIHAFEPDAEIFKLLKQNLQPYNFNDVFLHEKAVWVNDQDLSFVSQGGSSGKIGFSENASKVGAIRLKDFLQNQQIDFLKMDIEGAEYHVLLDCKDELKNIKTLFIEYHSFYDEEQHLDEILLFIKSAGFTYYIQHETTSNSPFVSINSIGNMNLQINIFCYKNL